MRRVGLLIVLGGDEYALDPLGMISLIASGIT